ncbi:hypothetical protein [Methylobacter sp. S3L5C]|uniref:hypothetical protein n=1 Tax=Methylobacter sp. S3L5C TaxID=2839024 RepID=UPI001FAD7804|nr:hypothetical protein [Methylobacter sp. S3L5C]UOA09843.1 hypothetical protein KKZ03_06160 [Methylobacter sp. S3L5C]
MALTEQQLKNIKTWQARGSSQTAYCQAHGLNKKSFQDGLAIIKHFPKQWHLR